MNSSIPQIDLMGMGSIGNLGIRQRPFKRARFEPLTVAAAEIDAELVAAATQLLSQDSIKVAEGAGLFNSSRAFEKRCMSAVSYIYSSFWSCSYMAITQPRTDSSMYRVAGRESMFAGGQVRFTSFDRSMRAVCQRVHRRVW
jgi:hypothetical protein